MRVRVASAVGVALACMLAIASQAGAQETFWSAGSNQRTPIPIGEHVPVAAAGSLRLKVNEANGESERKLVKMSCNIEGVETFTNNLVNGEGETTSISFSCNEGVVITALGLPWKSLLTYPSWPLVNKWSGVSLHIYQGATDLGIYEEKPEVKQEGKPEATLHPEIGDLDSQGEIEGRLVDDPDYTLKFKLGNRLVDPSAKRELTVVGSYKLGTKGVKLVTGEVPGGFVYVGKQEKSAVTAAVGKLHQRLALARMSGDHDAS